MKRTFTLLTCCVGLTLLTKAQVSFTNSSSLLNDSYYSGGVVGVVDMNNDRLDDIVIFDEADHIFIEYQNADGSFTQVDYGNISPANQWGAAIGEIDGDGHKDIFSGGSYDGVHCLQITGVGQSIYTALNNGAMFMQCANMADIDNDGHLDAFGCHDDAESRIWINDGTGLLDFQTVIDFTTNPASDMSGNYGSTWTDVDHDGDIDLYIAKCRQFVNDPTDPRRINVLYINDGNGNYSNEATARGVDFGDQSWSADFGDIDNDGDNDLLVVNHDNTAFLYENDGNGYFSDITAGSGVAVTGFFLQCLMRDFDNDGYLDIIMSGGANHFFTGNGDGTFNDQSSAIAWNDDLHSFGLGDLNADGFIDYYASYGETYVNPDFDHQDELWLNDGNSNNWVAFELKGTISNPSGVGATTRIYGPWGIQTREVRAGESYGINNSFTAHFGLGAETLVDSVVINWPSGIVDTYYNVNAGSYYTAVEDACLAPDVDITLSAAQPVVCTGGTPLTLSANPGFSYSWNTGETTQDIVVTTGGTYTVTIDDGTGCTNFMSITIQQDPDETPIITSDSGNEVCDGDVVTVSTMSTNPLTWSDGTNGSSIQVTQTSSVTVTAQGYCGPFTSAPLNINFNPASPTPTTTGDNLPGPGPGTITSTGSNVSWYDAQTGGSLLGTGSPWTTPTVTATQSFWAEVVDFPNPGSNTGKTDNDPSFGGYFTNNNRYLFFDALAPFTIQSVKVYANGAGDRDFAIVDENTNQQVASGTFALWSMVSNALMSRSMFQDPATTRSVV